MRRQNADSRHTPRWVNTSYKIAGTRCNGCDYLEVLLRQRRFCTEEHYYCNYRKVFINPKEIQPDFCRGFGEVRSNKDGKSQ